MHIFLQAILDELELVNRQCPGDKVYTHTHAHAHAYAHTHIHTLTRTCTVR